MARHPKRAGADRRIYTDFLPPFDFIAAAMEFAMVSPTERDREFIAHLPSERPVLRKAR